MSEKDLRERARALPFYLSDLEYDGVDYHFSYRAVNVLLSLLQQAGPDEPCLVEWAKRNGLIHQRPNFPTAFD